MDNIKNMQYMEQDGGVGKINPGQSRCIESKAPTIMNLVDVTPRNILQRVTETLFKVCLLRGVGLVGEAHRRRHSVKLKLSAKFKGRSL